MTTPAELTPALGPVLVGEDNPYGSRPEFALYHEPPNSAGGRMCRLVCGLPTHAYRALSRHNLCVGGWSMPKAREAAQALRASYARRVFVLCGRKVTAAFGLDVPPFSIVWPSGPIGVLASIEEPVSPTFIVLPHPSGRNTTWLAPGAYARARALLIETCPGVPWGSA